MITQLPQIVMKRLTVLSDFEEWGSFPFRAHGGEPAPQLHSLKYQESWLEEVRGDMVPFEVMDSFARLTTVAQDNNVYLEDLCACSRDGCRGTKGKQPWIIKAPPMNSFVASENHLRK